MEKNRHFTTVVIGDNPSEIIKKYDKNLKVEPYIAYRIGDAKIYKERALKSLESCINTATDGKIKTLLIDERNNIQNMEDVDYYIYLTRDYEIDEETGNVVLTDNPHGKYDWCRPGKDLCMPMIGKNGEEIFKGKKSEIDWSKTHRYNTWTYETVWDLVMGDRKPQGEIEKKLYDNMKNRKDYFAFFKTKENYVLSNTSFWGYAYLDENGWVELEDNVPQFEWVSRFYETFIEPLSEDTLITLYECYRN